MKEFFRRLGWRLKWRWQICGGHYVNEHGVYAMDPPFKIYRYVWHHKKHGIRYEDREIKVRWREESEV